MHVELLQCFKGKNGRAVLERKQGIGRIGAVKHAFDSVLGRLVVFDRGVERVSKPRGFNCSTISPNAFLNGEERALTCKTHDSLISVMFDQMACSKPCPLEIVSQHGGNRRVGNWAINGNHGYRKS